VAWQQDGGFDLPSDGHRYTHVGGATEESFPVTWAEVRNAA